LTNGTAGNTDYTTTDVQVTIPAGSTTINVPVPTTDDTIDETDETFSIAIGSVDAGTVGDTSDTATGTITDNDGAPSIIIDDASVIEGGVLSFPVRLSNPCSSDRTITFTFTNGTAGYSDYTTTDVQVIFLAGSTTATIDVPTTDDTIYEGDENFTVSVGSVDVGTLGDTSDTAIGTIIDDDPQDIDTDDDGILDSFEDLNADGDNDPTTNPTDSDNDGVPDYMDIDSDNDGIPDNVEAQSTSGYIPPSGVDANSNGLDDAYETGGNLGIIPENTDGTDLPDYLDLDTDNDNIPDATEGHDHNQDGLPDVVFIGSDKDNDGLDDGYEGSVSIDIDVNDEIDDPFNDLPNTDGDSESDYRDTDDDDDGIMTTDEDVNTDGDYTNDDEDGDGIPNYLDLPMPEDIEVYNGVTPNGDGSHDVFTIKNIASFPVNTVKIYNRWGVLVFETKGYNNESNYFNGISQARATISKEEKLPTGTYFYVLDYEAQEGVMRNKTGYLYLVR